MTIFLGLFQTFESLSVGFVVADSFSMAAFPG